MFHNKIDKSSIARKISCFKSFEKFLYTQNIKLNLNLFRPKIDKKLPIYLTIDEIFGLLDNVKDDDLPSTEDLKNIILNNRQPFNSLCNFLTYLYTISPPLLGLFISSDIINSNKTNF